MTAKRYHDLDALRAVAMLLGIVLHGILSFVGWLIWPVQCEPIRTLWDSGHVHSWVPHVLVLFRERILYHDDVAKEGHGRLLVHRFKRIVLPFFVLGFLIFPMLNNMKALADWVGEGSEERVAESSEDKETRKRV